MQPCLSPHRARPIRFASVELQFVLPANPSGRAGPDRGCQRGLRGLRTEQSAVACAREEISLVVPRRLKAAGSESLPMSDEMTPGAANACRYFSLGGVHH